MGNGLEKLFNIIDKFSNTQQHITDKPTPNIQNNIINENNSENSDKDTTQDVEEFCDKATILPENQLFADMLDKDILLVMEGTQLNILGQVFRPMFTGRVAKVSNGYLTLDPVIIKMNTAPFFKFPTQLNFPLDRITYFVPFDPNTKFSIP